MSGEMEWKGTMKMPSADNTLIIDPLTSPSDKHISDLKREMESLRSLLTSDCTLPLLYYLLLLLLLLLLLFFKYYYK